jgi:hypothetical protein
MKKFIQLLITIFVLFLSFYTVSETITNGTAWNDTSENRIHAHGGGMIKVGDYYYWFGEDRYTNSTLQFRSVKCYRSTNLKDWEFRNNVLTNASGSDLGYAKIERPKVIYCPSTGKYVMWMHKEFGDNYSEARCAVATSDTIDGNYTYQGSFRPLNYMSRDCTAFVDDDGTAYFISAANKNRDLHIYRLTSNYESIDSLVQKIWIGQSREAPAIFKRNGYYFIITSGCTGWAPNQGAYGYATSISGNWSSLRNIGDSTTYDSQSTFVLPIADWSGGSPSFLYIGDRWLDPNYVDSKYIWLPINFFSNTSLSMSYSTNVTVNTTGSSAYSPAIHSVSSEQAENQSSKILDGNTADESRWSAEGFPQWVIVDYGENRDITETGISTYQDRAYQYYIYGSTDLADVQNEVSSALIVDRSGNTSTSQPITDTFNTKTIRYLKLKIVGASVYTGSWSSITELEVAEDGSSPGGFDPNASYRIVNRNSGKTLTISGDDKNASAAPIQQYPDTGANYQRWRVVLQSDGYYHIISVASGQYFDINGASTEDGAINIQWPNNGGNNQDWSIVDQGSSYYHIINRNSGKLLDIEGASTADGAQNLQWSENSGYNQDWQFIAD